MVAAPFFLFFVAVELLTLVTNVVLFVSCIFVDGAMAGSYMYVEYAVSNVEGCRPVIE